MADQSDLTKQELDRLAAKIREVVKFPCPRCGNSSATLVDGHISLPISDTLYKVVIGGKVVPVVSTVCDRCGFISMHAYKVLFKEEEGSKHEGP
jgi:ribosomal protein S27AE